MNEITAIHWLAGKWKDLHIEYHEDHGWQVSTCYADGEWGEDGWISTEDGSLLSALMKAVELTYQKKIRSTKMLMNLIEKMEELVAEKTCNGLDFATISVFDLRILAESARLLCDIHEEADNGAIDGVALDWMTKVDSLIIGLEENSA